MSKPSFYVASGHTRLDRENRQKLLADFCNTGVISSEDGGRIVETLNYCIERRLPFSISWEGKITTIKSGRPSA